MAKNYDAQIAKLKAEREALDAKLNKVAQKAKEETRKRDTRRKIVVGGAVLAAMEKNKDLAAVVRTVLAAYVGRPHDKEVIADLLNELNNPAPPALIQEDAPLPPPPPANDAAPSPDERATAPATTAANPFPFLSRI